MGGGGGGSKGGFRRALMGRLDTGHVSACALELESYRPT